MDHDKPRRPTINSAELIKLVKKQPCLYDNQGGRNHELKNAAWGEVASNMFGDEWPEFSIQEKDALVKDLQTRWKNLRDTFARQVRTIEQAKAGRGNFPAHKYVFFDALKFLVPHFNKGGTSYQGNLRRSFRFEETSLSAEESKDSNDSTNEDEKPLKELAKAEPNDTTTTPSAAKRRYVPIKPKPTKPPTTIYKEYKPAKPVEVVTVTMNSDAESEPPMKKVAQCLTDLVAMQKEDRIEDSMGNKRFLLSLMPFMKKLPDDVNLEVRLQLMSVLQTYSGGKGLQS